MKETVSGRKVAQYVRTIRVLIALILVLLLVCGILTWLLIKPAPKAPDPKVPDATSLVESGTEQTSSQNAEEQALMALADELDDWNLRLVNRDHPLPEEYTLETAKINASYARDIGMAYDARAVSSLNAMCAAAEKDGVSLLVISSFRTRARQTTLFQNQLAKVKTNHPSYSEEEATKAASMVSAYPGTSEHELGLAVDFNSVEETFAQTAQFAWLQNHAAEYGFIMRYPKSKEDITGVIYEPWHYRYVGMQHAKKINELGYCLEEYITYLEQYSK